VKVEKAKEADRGAVAYARGKLKKSDRWIEASEEERDRIYEETVRQVLYKRYVLNWISSNFYTNHLFRTCDKKNWQYVAWENGWGEEGGVYAMEDDGNPVWEEWDAPDDEREAMLRADERLDFGGEDRIQDLLAKSLATMAVDTEADSLTGGMTIIQKQAAVS